MKFALLLFITIILSILFAGCDPTYQVDYKVINETGEPLTVIVKNNDQRLDTSIIANQTSLIFFNDFGIGLSTSDYLDALTLLPVELSLFDHIEKSYSKSEEDISNWHKFYPPKKGDGLGIVQLTVRAEDF